MPELPFPHILGSDAAGEVAVLGEGVTGFEVGERVVPVPGYPLNEADYDIFSCEHDTQFCAAWSPTRPVVRHLRGEENPGRKSARTGSVSLTQDCLSLASSPMVSMQGGFNHDDTTAV